MYDGDCALLLVNDIEYINLSGKSFHAKQGW
jgi:hypothetical protein